MIKFPRLKTFLTIFPISDTAWGVRGGNDEVWRITLSDPRAVRAFGVLLPYLNGRTSIEEILGSLDAAGIHRKAALAVFKQLETTSLIEEADPSGLSDAELIQYEDQIRFFSRFTQQGGAKFQAALRDARVALVADGPLGESMYGRLADAGIGEVIVLTRESSLAARWIERVQKPPQTTVRELAIDTLWPEETPLPRLAIVCQETHDPQLLEAIDELSKRRRVPWLLVRNLELQEGWVGPLFVAGETASYLSLEARLRAAMARLPEYQAFDAHVRETGRPASFGGLKATLDILAGVAMVEAIKFITEIAVPELLGKFVTINLWTWETEVHEVLRVPALDRRNAPRPAVFPWKLLVNENNNDDNAPSSSAGA